MSYIWQHFTALDKFLNDKQAFHDWWVKSIFMADGKFQV